MPERYSITFYSTQMVVAYRDIDAEGPEDAAIKARLFLDNGNAPALAWVIDGEPDVAPANVTFDVIDATSDEFLGTEADLGVRDEDYL